MKRALILAQKGRGRVSPNPLVGAVFARNGRILAEGYHKEFGGDHAEIEAIKRARASLRGATLYVSLEPCYHQGKTPPCVSALSRLGLRRVVVAVMDPNPLVKGKGIIFLEKAGIEVQIGLLEEEARLLNQPFFKHVTKKMPYVTMKFAMSLDGKICCRDGSSRWISSEDSRKEVHRLRAAHDAVLIGINTVLADDPDLGVRLFRGRDPKRVILDSSLRILPDSQVLRDGNVIIVTTNGASKAKEEVLKKKGVMIWKYDEIGVERMCRDLCKAGLSSVLVEGGEEINGSFCDHDLVDRYVSFVAPKIIGGKGAKSPVGGQGATNMVNLLTLLDWKIKKTGSDIMIEAYRRFY